MKILERTCDETECTKPTNCDLCQATRLYEQGYRKLEQGEQKYMLKSDGTLEMIPTVESVRREVERELIDLITEILMNNIKPTRVGDKAILEIHENIFDRLEELKKEHIGE